jgi:hypothetical protein
MRIPLGSRVRIAGAQTLGAALRSPDERRPEPGQMAWAGRDARIVGYRRGAGSRALYALQDAPGLWSEEWIAPLDSRLPPAARAANP